MENLLPESFQLAVRETFVVCVGQLASGNEGATPSGLAADSEAIFLPETETVIDGVPLVLTVAMRSEFDSSGSQVKGFFDLGLYHRELDLSFADHLESFQQEATRATASELDPWPWFNRAFAGARAELEESSEFLALRDAAQLRLAIACRQNGARAAPRL